MAASTASADDGAGTVSVFTKDGAEYRGELVERVPNDHVTIKEATGDVKRFAWADVAEVRAGEGDEKKDCAEKKDDEAKPPQVRLVVDGEPGVLLERRQTEAEGWNATIWPGYAYVETWEVACAAPCKTVVDAASTYRVNGGGVAASRNFSLPPGRDPLKLHLVARSALLHGTAIAVTFAGGILALAGAASLASSPAISDAAAAADVRGLGWAGVATGGIMLVAGIATWILTYSYARTDDGTSLGAARPLVPRFVF